MFLQMRENRIDKIFFVFQMFQNVREEHLLLGQVRGREVRVSSRHASQGLGQACSQEPPDDRGRMEKAGSSAEHGTTPGMSL